MRRRGRAAAVYVARHALGAATAVCAGAAPWLAAGAAPAAGDAPRAAASVDLTSLTLSLAAVLGLVLAAAFVVRRLPGGFGFTARSSGPLKVVATLALGPKERLLLVDARGTEVLVAVTPAGVSILSPAAAPRAVAAAADVGAEFALLGTRR
jgi:flagellar protein FliO/FliZ